MDFDATVRPAPETEMERFLLEQRRKQRREGILLLVVGAVFTAGGLILIFAADNPWMGAVGVPFGLMIVFTGLAKLRGEDSRGGQMLVIIGSALFAIASAAMMISGIVVPEVWGWRPGLAAIIAGAVGTIFFGAGAVIGTIKLRRRRR